MSLAGPPLRERTTARLLDGTNAEWLHTERRFSQVFNEMKRRYLADSHDPYLSLPQRKVSGKPKCLIRITSRRDNASFGHRSSQRPMHSRLF